MKILLCGHTVKIDILEWFQDTFILENSIFQGVCVFTNFSSPENFYSTNVNPFVKYMRKKLGQ